MFSEILSSKKKFILLGAIFIFFFASGLWFFLKQQAKKEKIVTPVGETEIQKSSVIQESKKDKLLENEWGLRVYYPDNLEVKTATGSGELTRYNFTHPDHPGYLTIYSKEIKEETLEDWLEKDKESASASGVIDTEIGGEEGKKMLLDNPERIRAVTVQEWQVFVFEAFLEKGEEKYWEDTLKHVLEKYEFLPFEETNVKTPAQSSSGGSTGDTSVELEEEIIE